MNTIKAQHKRTLTLLGLGLALIFLVACASQPPAPTSSAEASNTQPSSALAPVSSSGSGASSVSSIERSSASVMPSIVHNNGLINGISVSGQGKASATPDLVIINLGVEQSRDTVQAARDDAAAAMGRVIDVLKEQGVLDRDIQTRFFNIHPRYDQNGRNIIGYQVSNQVTAKVRNLDRVSTIIDQAARAGGDSTRFQDISFSVENTKALEEQARTAAVEDMTAKANQLATLTGVQLGKPMSIVESGGLQPISVPAFERAFLDQAAAPTPIMPGEVEVTVSLQAVYAIQ